MFSLTKVYYSKIRRRLDISLRLTFFITSAPGKRFSIKGENLTTLDFLIKNTPEIYSV